MGHWPCLWPFKSLFSKWLVSYVCMHIYATILPFQQPIAWKVIKVWQTTTCYFGNVSHAKTYPGIPDIHMYSEYFYSLSINWYLKAQCLSLHYVMNVKKLLNKEKNSLGGIQTCISNVNKCFATSYTKT